MKGRIPEANPEGQGRNEHRPPPRRLQPGGRDTPEKEDTPIHFILGLQENSTQSLSAPLQQKEL